jgi:hypothetical protein
VKGGVPVLGFGLWFEPQAVDRPGTWVGSLRNFSSFRSFFVELRSGIGLIAAGVVT